MKIEMIDVCELVPYENNPRFNEPAIDSVANSIKEFGFKVPIIVTKENVIVAGHTRLLAAQKLGLEKVPCIVADDLNEQQIKAFRLADNKVSELAEWDFSKLEIELSELDFDMSNFGFDLFDNTESYIDDLLENEYAEHRVESKCFSVTFTFDNEYQESLNAYIKENGKEKIVEHILSLLEM